MGGSNWEACVPPSHRFRQKAPVRRYVARGELLGSKTASRHFQRPEFPAPQTPLDQYAGSDPLSVRGGVRSPGTPPPNMESGEVSASPRIVAAHIPGDVGYAGSDSTQAMASFDPISSSSASLGASLPWA